MSDLGGGVPFRKMENLFSYMYSTAPTPQMDEKQRAPLVRHYIIFLILYKNIKLFQKHQFVRNISLHGLRLCFLNICLILSSGWVWLWAAHLAALCQVLPG